MDLVGLIPSFGGLFFTIAAFVIALSVIVFIHEYGHYIIGRLSGIHAEVFSLGFGPVLWARDDKHGTRWQVAALPFGGYVKFLGDANAASAPDGEAMAELTAAERRRTMPGAPLWARSATVLAGPVFNFILSILVFAGLFMWQGRETTPMTVAEILPGPYETQELVPGDVILGIGGQDLPEGALTREFLADLPKTNLQEYRVLRDGQERVVTAPNFRPSVVGAVNPRTAAIQSGIEKGDIITAIDGQPVFQFAQLIDIVGQSNGKELAVDIWRDGEMLQFNLAPKRQDINTPEGGFETRWLLGISSGDFFERASERPGLFEAIGGAAGQTFFVIESSISGLYHMAIGAISTCNISGPIGIAQVSGETASQGLSSFIWFIAVLSTAVGLINLFPIPVLDGGHLVFHAYEAVSGRKPGDKALRVMMAIGGGFLLTFMLFAIGNDLFCP